MNFQRITEDFGAAMRRWPQSNHVGSVLDVTIVRICGAVVQRYMDGHQWILRGGKVNATNMESVRPGEKLITLGRCSRGCEDNRLMLETSPSDVGCLWSFSF